MYGWKLAEKTYLNKRTVREKYVLDPTETLDHATYLKAYYRVRANVTSLTGNPDVATTEFTDTDYDNIASDDEVYVSHSGTVTISGRYVEVAHKFVFDLTKFVTLPNILTQIEYGWDGYATANYFHVYRKTPTEWKVVSDAVPDTDGDEIEFMETITKMTGVLVDKQFIFGVHGSAFYVDTPITLELNTDYVYVTVTYRVTDLLNSPIVQPKVIGVSGYER